MFANGHGPGDPTWLIGSADLMPRNLDGRVEALVPIVSPEARAQLLACIEFLREDDSGTFELGADARWYRLRDERGLSAQRRSRDAAVNRSRRT
jgi:polyphosphate kinase